ncbi:glycosyltransferase family 4 protein [Ornithinimicrobium sp. Arc0846-15]|nr:glycosyltransferase family 4 protein [Ornithinimicrobium laminariae]
MPNNFPTLVVADLGDSPSGGDRFHEQVARVWQRDLIRIRGSWPYPTMSEREQLTSTLTSVRGPVVLDGLLGCAGPNVLAHAHAQGARPWLLVHLPLAADCQSAAEAGELNCRERAALDLAAGVITTSEWSKADLVRRHGPRDVTVVEPGVALPSTIEPRSAASPPHLVTVASYTPRKNYGLLIAALAQITDLEWQSTWAGAAPEGETRRLQELLHTHGLTDRVQMTGPLNDLEVSRLWRQSDLLVFPSRFETYGMVITEALTHGIPAMVSADTASEQTLAGPMGLLPGMALSAQDPTAWAHSLRQWLVEPPVRESWGSWVAERNHHVRTWETCAQDLAKTVGGHRVR